MVRVTTLLCHFRLFSQFRNFSSRLTMLKTPWADYPQMVKESLERCLLRTVPDFNAVDLLRFLKGSSNIGYQWIERAEIKEATLRTVSRPRFVTSLKEKPELATVIDQYLRAVGINWDLLPDGTRQRFHV
jgi:hypothetical protein